MRACRLKYRLGQLTGTRGGLMGLSMSRDRTRGRRHRCSVHGAMNSCSCSWGEGLL